jgi:hypothetical protein
MLPEVIACAGNFRFFTGYHLYQLPGHMDYASIYFSKPLGQLTYEDIETFFQTEREETDQLEFKSFHPAENFEGMLSGVIAGIASFLNSSGGVLIWGAPKGDKPPKESGKKEKVFRGALYPIDRVVEKDWLISRVSDKIVPLPGGIRVQILERDGNRVCVFEVDESPTSPHQHEGTYYMRIDGQKKPAPHHYVEALMKKITYPVLKCHIKPLVSYTHHNTFKIDIMFLFLNASPFENEEEFSYKIQVDNGKFSNVVYHASHPSYVANTLMPGFKSDSEYKSPQKGEILHCSDSVQVNFSFDFAISDLRQKENKAALRVYFGGKKSPIKYCHYKLDFSGIDPMASIDIKSIFKILVQNTLMSDIHAAINYNEDEKLEKFGFLR